MTPLEAVKEAMKEAGKKAAQKAAREAGMSREERLSSMVLRYQGLLLNICYAYLCDPDQAQDAVQETFLKAYKGMHSFRGECSEKTWLVTIARNTCRDMRRCAWLRHVDRGVAPEDLPGAAAGASEEERELTAAVLQLPDKLKEAVVLYYYQNFSMAETAGILGITQPSVSGRLSRARKKLKVYLEKGDVK